MAGTRPDPLRPCAASPEFLEQFRRFLQRLAQPPFALQVPYDRLRRFVGGFLQTVKAGRYIARRSGRRHRFLLASKNHPAERVRIFCQFPLPVAGQTKGLAPVLRFAGDESIGFQLFQHRVHAARVGSVVRADAAGEIFHNAVSMPWPMRQ